MRIYNMFAIMSEAFSVIHQSEADELLSQYITHIYITNHNDINMQEARKIAKDNLGYFSGYTDLITAERMEKLFGCVHPILGDVTTRKTLSPQEVYRKGIEFGSKVKKLIENK